MVGFVQDCAGFTPNLRGSLCGARGSYLTGHYLWVAATEIDTVTVVDVHRPEMPTVAGSVRDPTRLKQVVATWMHHSNEYVVALARGRRPQSDGHLTLVDVRPSRWYQDQSQRFLAAPKVVSWLKDCYTSDDPTFPRKLGRMCGARAMHVVGDIAYVVSEISHALSIIRLPAQLSDDINGRPPMTIYPEFVGSLQDRRLHGAYAVAIKGNNAYVASRWCKTCLVMVHVLNPAMPTLGGRLPGATVGTYIVVESLDENVAASDVGRLRGFEFVARGVDPGATYAFITTEFDGRVSVVDARCVAASEALGESVQYCARGARIGACPEHYTLRTEPYTVQNVTLHPARLNPASRKSKPDSVPSLRTKSHILHTSPYTLQDYRV
mmetsp:Transcript_43699/g.70247  ORF Transcript_43699/g.70247 Transcript_43699/m.70247 type:complete len:380 (+) Transcript_43699:185-1324(+)